MNIAVIEAALDQLECKEFWMSGAVLTFGAAADCFDKEAVDKWKEAAEKYGLKTEISEKAVAAFEKIVELSPDEEEMKKFIRSIENEDVLVIVGIGLSTRVDNRITATSRFRAMKEVAQNIRKNLRKKALALVLMSNAVKELAYDGRPFIEEVEERGDDFDRLVYECVIGRFPVKDA